MSTERELLKRAREALESCMPGDYSTGSVCHPSFDEALVNKAYDDIDAHLKEPVTDPRCAGCSAATAEVPLAKNHEGMRVDYTGMLGEAERLLRAFGNDTLAFMLNEFKTHLTELGERFYEGDMTVMDEFLQLYCVTRDRRQARAAIAQGGGLEPSAISRQVGERAE